MTACSSFGWRTDGRKEQPGPATIESRSMSSGTRIVADDPVLSFVTSASVGQESFFSTSIPPGTVRMTLLRVYAAASGRDCREFIESSAAQSQSRVFCEGADGWSEAHPLLAVGNGPR